MTGSLGVPNIYVSGAIQGDSYLPNKVLVADASSNIVTSSVSSSELNALSGVTSGVQTQLNNKIAHPLTAPTSGQYLKYNGSAIQWSTPPGGGGDLMADGSVPMTGALQADSGVKFGSTGNTIAKVLKASAASWTESTWDKASDAQQAGGYMAIYCSTGTATFSGVAVGDIVVANPILSSGTFGSLPFVSATVVATTTASSVSIRVCVSNNATPSGVSGTMNMAAYSIN